MTKHEATEQAYKKGYDDGKRDAVKHGTWSCVFFKDIGFSAYQCSECEKFGDSDTSYCPHCGAKMSHKESDNK